MYSHTNATGKLKLSNSCDWITDSEAGDIRAPRTNGLSSFLVDGYSEVGITGQLREEAGPCPDRR